MERCKRSKCGEYNMLRCVMSAGHEGGCNFVVDHENDYPWNKLPRKKNRVPHVLSPLPRDPGATG